jgi:Mn2+/Fe2+ NRAMP family transporter
MDREDARGTAPEARTGLDPWGRAELPAPPSTKGLRLLAVVGPGAIVLGAAIGSGEWLIGPAAFVKYGMSLLWVTMVAVSLQAVLNTEAIRYTLYTGEPVFTGFMRTRPGSTFWAGTYTVLYLLQSGWPGWAGASAGAFFYLFAGRPAAPGDSGAVYAIGVAAFVVCVLLLVFSGRRIERMLEVLNWVMVVMILGGLVVLCALFAGPREWLSAVLGFAGFDLTARSFRFVPEGVDWFLIGAFAAFSGCGGAVNLTLSNWVRDKGYGMGQVVGFIPALVGGQKVHLAHSGSVFEPSAAQLGRWAGWWRIVRYDQWGIFFAGSLLGMALPGILYTASIPRGTELRGLAIASELAHALSPSGSAALVLALALMSVWILFKAQLDNLEGMNRVITDILWSGSRRVRAWRGGDVRVVYYSVLAVIVTWGVVALGLTQPIVLLQIGGNVAGLTLAVSALHILYLNTRLLPEPLRPPLWRRAGLVLTALFYGFFVCLWLGSFLGPRLAAAIGSGS